FLICSGVWYRRLYPSVSFALLIASLNFSMSAASTRSFRDSHEKGDWRVDPLALGSSRNRKNSLFMLAPSAFNGQSSNISTFTSSMTVLGYSSLSGSCRWGEIVDPSAEQFERLQIQAVATLFVIQLPQPRYD